MLQSDLISGYDQKIRKKTSSFQRNKNKMPDPLESDNLKLTLLNQLLWRKGIKAPGMRQLFSTGG
jgi:hypothetical protein